MSAIDEKRFTAHGREWVARFDFNAMCAVEERRGRAFLEVVAPMLQRLAPGEVDDQGKALAAARSIRMSDIRLLFHQSLLGAQPELTETDAGELIGAIGFQQTMLIVAWAVTKALGDSSEGSGAAGEANPPAAAAKKNQRSRQAGSAC